MGFKINKQDGGSGALFWVLLVVMLYAAASGIIAYQTVEKCGSQHSAKSWRVYPPGWVCEN